MTRLALPACALLLITSGFAACADEADSADNSGPAFEVTVAPLLLPGVTDVNYTLTVANSDDTNLTTVSFSSAGSGDGTGFARYVAPCDADSEKQPNKISLEVGTVWTGTSPKTALDVDVPTVLVKEENCTADISTTVAFDIYGVQSAGQGFFDILIGFENIYCSAKLDCTSAPAMFPNANSSMVLGLVCAAGSTAVEDTTLYMNNISIACGAAGNATINPNRAGNLPAAYLDDPDGLIQDDDVTVSRGEDTLAATDELFWNVAIGLSDAAVGADDCTFTVQATTAGGSLGASSPYTTATDYPVIDWNVTAVTSGALACTNHPIGGDGTGGEEVGVSVKFPAAGGTTAFKHEYDGPRQYVFATSDAYTPGTHFSSLADADVICQRHALAGGLEGSYVAWLSVSSPSTVNAKDRIADASYTLSDLAGTTIDSSLATLTDGTILSAIDADENGVAVAGDAWTGTGTDGDLGTTHCVDWTSSLDTDTGDVGTSTLATGSWTASGTAACDQAKRLYCFPAK